MVSKASEDLPDPESPVITISLSRGSSRSMFLRLCVRAPRMRMVSIAMGELASGCGWGWPPAGPEANKGAERATDLGANGGVLQCGPGASQALRRARFMCGRAPG